MNIRNPEHFLGSFWNWEAFNDCFEGTRIRITDVDGLVERNGYFLLLETKRPGVTVPMGQRILFDRICENTRWNVLVIWGETDQPEYWHLWRHPQQIYRGDLAALKTFIRRWFEWVNERRAS